MSVIKSTNLVKIDATGQVLGRLSVKVADILRGKNSPAFSYNELTGNKVVIFNAEKIYLSGKKIDSKVYYRHSAYIGNLKSTNLKDMMKKDPSWVIRESVKGMLPKNKLRNLWLKNLEIHNQALEK